MPQLFGRNTFLLSGKETTWASASGSLNVYTRVYSMGLTRTQQREPKGDLSTSSGAFSQAHFDVFEEAGGSLELPLQYEGIGLFLYSALGEEASAADGSLFIHSYTAGTTALPSMTIQVQRGSLGTKEEFLGCKVASMEISGSAGEEVKMNLEIIAKTSASSSPALSPSYGDGKQAYHYECSNMSITPSGGGATTNYSLNNFTLTLNNAIERKNVLGSKQTSEPEVTDFRTVELAVELFQLDVSLFDLQLAGTPQDIEIELVQTGTNHYIKLLLYNAVITSYDDVIDTVGRLTESATFQAFSDSSKEALKIEIRNQDSSAIAN